MDLNDLLARCDAITADETSGATSLTLTASDILLDALEMGSAAEVALRLMQSKPMMASILNVAQLAVSSPDTEEAISRVVTFRDTLRKAPRRAAVLAVDRLKSSHDGPYRVLTVSASAAVEHTLMELGDQGLISSVIVGESRPRNEGEKMAHRLSDRVPFLQVTYDAALPGMVDRDAAVVIGADAVLPDRVINKAGSLPLCLAAFRGSRPVMVVATSHKVLSQAAREHYRLPHASPNTRGFIDIQFEEIPRDLLTAVVVEGGTA